MRKQVSRVDLLLEQDEVDQDLTQLNLHPCQLQQFRFDLAFQLQLRHRKLLL